MASRTTSVKIRFAHRDTLPPVYIAGSFSETPWIPQEMEYIATADGQFLFSKEVELEAGKEYQYKFRLGPGDWWVLDEEAPIGM